jgi:hypothetical protein
MRLQHNKRGMFSINIRPAVHAPRASVSSHVHIIIYDFTTYRTLTIYPCLRYDMSQLRGSDTISIFMVASLWRSSAISLYIS